MVAGDRREVRSWKKEFRRKKHRLGDTMTTTVSAVSDRSLSETTDLNGDLGEKTRIPLSVFGELISDDICSVLMDAPVPNETEARDRSPSETPDLQGVLEKQIRNTLLWVRWDVYR